MAHMRQRGEGAKINVPGAETNIVRGRFQTGASSEQGQKKCLRGGNFKTGAKKKLARGKFLTGAKSDKKMGQVSDWGRKK